VACSSPPISKDWRKNFHGFLVARLPELGFGACLDLDRKKEAQKSAVIASATTRSITSARLLERAGEGDQQRQAIVWKANNHAFNRGVTLDSIGGLNLGLPGQYWDAESGLWHNGYRDYDYSSGRYLQSDPIGLEGGLNTYSYVGSNTANATDPLGLDTLVILGGETSSNPFGHVAIAFTGRGVYSYGTDTPLGSSLTAYLASQARYRTSTLIRISTTSAQEKEMLSKVLSYKGIPLPNPKQDPIGAFQNTCAVRTQQALAVGGIKSSLVPMTSPLPADTGIIAGMNSSGISILWQGSPVPSGFESFNP
jgi:RHS repeat-associated protein